MRNALAFIGLASLFLYTIGQQARPLPTPRVIAQHQINQQCLDGKKCVKTVGSISYTAEGCYIKLDSTTFYYSVLHWNSKDKILTVEGGELKGFIIIEHDAYIDEHQKLHEGRIRFDVQPKDGRRYRSFFINYITTGTTNYGN